MLFLTTAFFSQQVSQRFQQPPRAVQKKQGNQKARCPRAPSSQVREKKSRREREDELRRHKKKSLQIPRKVLYCLARTQTDTRVTREASHLLGARGRRQSGSREDCAQEPSISRERPAQSRSKRQKSRNGEANGASERRPRGRLRRQEVLLQRSLIAVGHKPTRFPLRQEQITTRLARLSPSSSLLHLLPSPDLLDRVLSFAFEVEATVSVAAGDLISGSPGRAASSPAASPASSLLQAVRDEPGLALVSDLRDPLHDDRVFCMVCGLASGLFRFLSSSNVVSFVRSLPRAALYALVHFTLRGLRFILKLLWHLDRQNLKIVPSFLANDPPAGIMFEEQNQHVSKRIVSNVPLSLARASLVLLQTRARTWPSKPHARLRSGGHTHTHTHAHTKTKSGVHPYGPLSSPPLAVLAAPAALFRLLVSLGSPRKSSTFPPMASPPPRTKATFGFRAA